ncbi:HIRAN domain-containing protein [Immundisolibacter sp.]
MALSLYPARLLARLPRLFVAEPDIPPLYLCLAGFQHHRAEGIWSFLRPGLELRLRREPWNRHDPLAVAVYYRQEKLGYLPRSDNAAVARWLDQGRTLRASIASLADSGYPGGRVQLRLQLIRGTPEPS